MIVPPLYFGAGTILAAHWGNASLRRCDGVHRHALAIRRAPDKPLGTAASDNTDQNEQVGVAQLSGYKFPDLEDASIFPGAGNFTL